MTFVSKPPDVRSQATENAEKVGFERINLTFDAAGGDAVEVLKEVNLAVSPGEFVSIVGPSGCGKSTLLRILAGLVQPTSGRVRIDGKSLSDNRERVGFMFQRDTLLPWATVEQNIRVGAELAGVPRNQIGEKLEKLIDFLRLTGFENRRPHQLSGGMRQRVSLGRLLAYEPEIYLMDEPFGALDSQTKIAMGRELLRIWSLHRRSVLFVTHDIDEAVTLSDRVIVLSARPGTIKLDLKIDLERPRDPQQLRKNLQFGGYIDQIWSALE